MQRRTIREEYLGFRSAAAILDLLAMVLSLRATVRCESSCRQLRVRAASPGWGRYAAASPSFFRGIPIAIKNCRASSSLRADVTNVMFIP